MLHKSIRPARRTGFTFAELMVTLSIMGVLAAVAIPVYSNITKSSKEKLAVDHMESLNRAVAKFSQNCWKLPTPANNAATTDEFLVLRSLQYKFPVSNLKVGSPYFDPRYNPSTSSSTNDLRIRWNGTSFELLTTGTAGTGLRYSGGSEYTTPYSFPNGYQPGTAS